MAFMKTHEVRQLSQEERTTRIRELRQDLMHERGVAAMGGSPPSPGKIRQLRRQIARILTINREQELGIRTSEGKGVPRARAPSKRARAGTSAGGTAPLGTSTKKKTSEA